jgi:hypothetical protein
MAETLKKVKSNGFLIFCLLCSPQQSMTASQGMMLSERPSGSLTGLGGSGPSLGNYKGVMLCNRPFGGVAAATRDSVDAGAAAVAAGRFVTGVVKTEPGYAAPQRVKDIVVVRQAKKKTALSRHRRWLADLQKTKDAREQQYMEGVQRKEEASRRFAEREAKSRHISLGATHTDDDRDIEHRAAASDEEHVYDADAQPKAAVAAKPAAAAAVKATDDADIGLSSTTALSNSKKHRHNKAGKRSNKALAKPLWALNQTDAAAAEVQAEEDEVSELLAFTKDLDFDKYIHDAEVQSMIDQVKRRIQELEKQEQADDTADNDNPDRPEVDDASTIGDNDNDDVQEEALAKRIMRLTDANLKRISSHGDNANNNSADDDAVSDVMSLARTVMSEGGKSVRTVHSTKSLAAVVTRSQAKQLGCIDESAAANKMETAVNVKLILHKEDGGMRLGGKNTVSNLPYIHRNPAI